MYKIFNNEWQPTPEAPFKTLDEAKRYIASLKEIYNETFYVVEWKVVFQS